MLSKVLYIGTGGFIGSVARYYIATSIGQHFSKSAFPFGTLIVNLLGCFVIGCLFKLYDTGVAFNNHLSYFLFVGLLGGFTTFSTFSIEALELLRNNHVVLGITYMLASVLLGLMLAWAGYSLIK
ncbi:MAG: fluoride efflux transporter CrcB [Candidatus Omnitrophica bacterium]|nr:fluoride efflux transporter CrcB [Candidatus Omnitrophota bacterium]